MLQRELWLPQRGVRSGLYQPAPNQLIDGQVFVMGFAFYNEGSLATDSQSVSADGDFLVEGIAAFADAPTPNFALQLFHQHGSEQRQLFFQQTLAQIIAGSKGGKFLLVDPYLIGAGDTITADIANMGKNGAAYVGQNIHVALHGVLVS